jgi:hypothetical protein
VIPQTGKVNRELVEAPTLLLSERVPIRLRLVQADLGLRDLFELAVPALFESPGNEAVLRVHRIELLERPVRRISSRFHL